MKHEPTYAPTLDLQALAATETLLHQFSLMRYNIQIIHADTSSTLTTPPFNFNPGPTCFVGTERSVNHVLIGGLGVGGQKVKIHVSRWDVVCVGSWFMYWEGTSGRHNATLTQRHTT